MAFGDAPFGSGPFGSEPGPSVLTAQKGTFSLTGNDAKLTFGYKLSASKGIFDVNVNSANLALRGEKGYTDHFREETGSTTGTEPLYLIQIDHPQLAVPIRVVNDTQDLGRGINGYKLRMPGFAANDLPVALDFDFTLGTVTPIVGYANLTCTRAGNTATRVNASGLIEVVLANRHRINFDPVSLQCLGLLAESNRTNTYLQSEHPELAPNSPSNITIGPNAITSPSGLLNGASISRTTIANASMGQNMSFVIGSTYTFSMYARKKSLGNRFALRIQSYPNRGGAVFNLLDGTLIGTETSGAGYITTAKIVDAGGGWWRCSVTVTIGTTPAVAVLWGPTDDSILTSAWEGGNLVASDCYVWGGQVELGGNATSYISTTTVSVVRNGDQYFMGVGSWYNPIKSTWVTEFNTSFIEAGNPRILGFNLSGVPTPASLVTGIAVASTWDNNDDTTTPNAYVLGTNGRTAAAYTARDSVLDYDFTCATITAQVGPTLAPLTFTRTGATGTRINGNGLVEVVPADTPRFDYDPITKLCLGILMEETRTNELPRATEFDNATWLNHGGDVGLTTITPNATISPDGTLTGEKFTNAGQTTADFGRFQDGGSSNGTYTFSVWLKAGTLSNARILIKDRGTDNIKGSLIAALTSTWQRFSITGTTVGGILGWRADISANAVNGDFFLWGAQVEAGSLMTSFIYTTTVPVVRNSDNLIGNVGSWFNAAEGTLEVEFDALAPAVRAVRAWALDFQDAGFNRLSIRGCDAGGINFPSAGIGTGTAVIPGMSGTVYTAGALVRFAVAYGTTQALAQTGVITASSSSPSAVVPQSTFGVGGGRAISAANQLNGHMKRFRYHNRRNANVEIQSVTLTGSNANDVALSLNGGTITTNGTSNFGVPTLVSVGSSGTSLWINGHIRKLTYLADRVDNTSVVEMARTAFTEYPTYAENWIACAFRVQFPDDVMMTQPRIPISIDNIGRELTQWLEASNGGKDATVTIMQVMRDTPDIIEQSFVLDLLDSQQNVMEVTANLGYSNVLDLPALTALQNTELQPGIF